MSASDSTPRRTWTRFALGLLGLHAVASVRLPWEDVGFAAAWLRASPDLVLLLALGLLVPAEARGRGLVRHGLTLALLFVPVYRFAVTVMPTFYGKELDPYDDVLMLPGLAHLLLHRFSPPVQALLWLAAAGGVLLLYAGVHGLVRSTLDQAARPAHRLAFLGACQALLLAGWALDSAAPDGARPHASVWAPSLLAPASGEVLGVVETWSEGLRYEEALARARAEQTSLPDDLTGLAGADVHILFVESYGRALFRHGESARRFASWAREWEDELATAGLHVVSGAMYPSISGGASSLAHAELFSGVPVPDRRAFDRLLASELEPLPLRLRRAGYRTVNVQPAMTEPWPEGKRFFGFDEHVFSAQLDYEGHPYPWGTMPDQFALNRVLTRVLPRSPGPTFVHYVSVTSHAPFSQVPPYIEDWAAASRPGAFARAPERSYAIDWMSYAGNPELEEAYLDTIRYSLRTMVGYACRLERPSLVLVLGDHQAPGLPNINADDTSYDVPVHAVSNREELLLPFVLSGFEPGFVPPPDYASFSSSLFLGNFLRLYSRESGG